MIENITLIVIWILVTLGISALAGILGKKYGLGYPIAIMASLVVIANVLANKIILFGPFTVPAGVIAFSTTYLITDIISEKWGKKYAKKAMWAGFYANVVLILSVVLAIAAPPAPFAQELSSKFAVALGSTSRIVLASFFAYVISQYHDIWAYHFWKKITKDKHLWLRNNFSTIVSQLISSVLFITIAFYGSMPIIPLILNLWIVKIILAVLDTPFLYLTVKIIDRI